MLQCASRMLPGATQGTSLAPGCAKRELVLLATKCSVLSTTHNVASPCQALQGTHHVQLTLRYECLLEGAGGQSRRWLTGGIDPTGCCKQHGHLALRLALMSTTPLLASSMVGAFMGSPVHRECYKLALK